MGIFDSTKSTRRRAPQRVSCATCGAEMDLSWGRWDRQPVEPKHCNGTELAFGAKTIESPHHARHKYVRCWKCAGDMGCSKCAGPIDQVLCIRCAVWTTSAAFIAHGPVLNTEVMIAKRGGKHAPGFDEYPPKFRYPYSEAHRNDPGTTMDQETRAQLNAVIHNALD